MLDSSFGVIYQLKIVLLGISTNTRTIQSYLGHNNIQHTVRYTELASGKFQGLWDD